MIRTWRIAVLLLLIFAPAACGQESEPKEGDSMYGMFSEDAIKSVFGDDELSVENCDSSANRASCVIYDNTLGHSVVTVNAGARSDGDGAKMAERVADLTRSGTEVDVPGLNEFDAARVTKDDSGVREKYYVGVATNRYLIHLIYTPGNSDTGDDAKAIAALIKDADMNLGDMIAGVDQSASSSAALAGDTENAPIPAPGDATGWLARRLG